MKQPSPQQKEVPRGYQAAENDMTHMKAVVSCSLRTKSTAVCRAYQNLSNVFLQKKDEIKEGDIPIFILHVNDHMLKAFLNLRESKEVSCGPALSDGKAIGNTVVEMQFSPKTALKVAVKSGLKHTCYNHVS